MPGIARPIPTASRRLSWKLALPILGLVAGAAFYAHAQAAPSNAQPQQAGATSTRMIGQHNRDHAYALVRESAHGTNMSGDSARWKDIEAAKRSIKGEFLWFRHDGKAWVVQDPDLLAKANAAWAPLDRLEAQMDGYGKQMDQHGKRMEALGKEMETAAAKIEPDRRQTRQFEREMQQLGHQMERLGDKMEDADGAERERLQRQMQQLSEKMNEMSRQVEREIADSVSRDISASMNDTSRRMHEASKPMDALGKQMGLLGKQMEQESRAADKVVRELIREALAKGLARPAPDKG
jgi:predicted  nucleic acid-binding Zn-ribbon protein